ncbi:unnamed protein product, partial [Closterium sp. NIES-53]
HPPPASSLPDIPDPEYDLAGAASPTVIRFLSNRTDPSFGSTAASALVTELVDFAARLQMASWKSKSTYIDIVPPLRANIVDGMWIFRVKQPPGSPPAFKECYVARGFSRRHGVDFFHTFSPTPKMTTLQVLMHIVALRDYELHSLDFSTSFLHSSLHEEIWLCRPPGFTRSFPEGTQWSLRQPVYGLCQVPREWHDTQRTTLAALGFAPSTADPSLFLSTDPSLPSFYILVYIDDLVFAPADTKALTLVKAEQQKRHTCIDMGELSFSASASSSPRHSPLLCVKATHSQLHLRTTPHLWPLEQPPLDPEQPPLAPGAAAPGPQQPPLAPGAAAPGPCDAAPGPGAAASLRCPFLLSPPPFFVSLLRVQPWKGGYGGGGYGGDGWFVSLPLLLLCLPLLQLSLRGVDLPPLPPLSSPISPASSSLLALSCFALLLVLIIPHFDYGVQSSSLFLVNYLTGLSLEDGAQCCEAEIYAGAMAAQELSWLTYLLSDLGERPCSPPVLYVDNKAMIALCR